MLTSNRNADRVPCVICNSDIHIRCEVTPFKLRSEVCVHVKGVGINFEFMAEIWSSISYFYQAR